MRAYVVLMQGPEWNEVVGVFADATPPARGTPAAGIRAGWLQQRLEAGEPEAMKRIPRGYRDRVYTLLSRYVVDQMEVE